METCPKCKLQFPLMIVRKWRVAGNVYQLCPICALQVVNNFSADWRKADKFLDPKANEILRLARQQFTEAE